MNRNCRSKVAASDHLLVLGLFRLTTGAVEKPQLRPLLAAGIPENVRHLSLEIGVFQRAPDRCDTVPCLYRGRVK